MAVLAIMSFIWYIIRAILCENSLKKNTVARLVWKLVLLIISLYLTKQHLLHRVLGILLFAIQLVLFSIYMLDFIIDVFGAIYTDYYTFSSPFNKLAGTGPLFLTSVKDQAPFPSTTAQYNDVTYHWNNFQDITLRDTYVRHYLRNMKIKDEICSICRDNFTNTDIYGNPWDPIQQQETSSNIYTTRCGHLFHRDCLWEYFNVTNVDHRYHLFIYCPNCNSLQRYHTQINLYDPNYIENNYDAVSLLAHTIKNPIPDPIKWCIQTIYQWLKNDITSFNYPANLYGVN